MKFDLKRLIIPICTAIGLLGLIPASQAQTVPEIEVRSDVARDEVTITGPHIIYFEEYTISFGCASARKVPNQKYKVQYPVNSERWSVTYKFKDLGINHPDSCAVYVYGQARSSLNAGTIISNAVLSSSPVTDNSEVEITYKSQSDWKWIAFFAKKQGADKPQVYYFKNKKIPLQTFTLSLIDGPGEYTITAHASKSEKRPILYNEIYLGRLTISNTDENSNRYLMHTQGIPAHDPIIADLARHIVGNESDNYKKLRALYSWVTQNISYDVDLLRFVKENPQHLPTVNVADTLFYKKGICYHYAALLVALLRSQGIPSRIIGGQYTSASGLSGLHAWVEAEIQSRWVLVDPTLDSGYILRENKKNGTTIERFIQKPQVAYFDPAPEVFNRTHKAEYIKPE